MKLIVLVSLACLLLAGISAGEPPLVIDTNQGVHLEFDIPPGCIPDIDIQQLTLVTVRWLNVGGNQGGSGGSGNGGNPVAWPKGKGLLVNNPSRSPAQAQLGLGFFYKIPKTNDALIGIMNTGEGCANLGDWVIACNGINYYIPGDAIIQGKRNGVPGIYLMRVQSVPSTYKLKKGQIIAEQITVDSVYWDGLTSMVYDIKTGTWIPFNATTNEVMSSANYH